jgi:chorismate-pyruvate lyase
VTPLEEFQELIGLFPAPQPLVRNAWHVPHAETPEPYRRMLVHDHHMTVTMEQYHGCKVDVHVLNRKLVSEDYYLREIVLTKEGTDIPVQFGVVRFHFEYVSREVRTQIIEEQIPLGRVLITHNVLRHIDLKSIIAVEAGPGLAGILKMPEGATTFGRLATIYCNHQPAVDLLEIASPL